MRKDTKAKAPWNYFEIREPGHPGDGATLVKGFGATLPRAIRAAKRELVGRAALAPERLDVRECGRLVAVVRPGPDGPVARLVKPRRTPALSMFTPAAPKPFCESVDYYLHPPKPVEPGEPRAPRRVFRVVEGGSLYLIHEGIGLTTREVVSTLTENKTVLGPDDPGPDSDEGYDLVVYENEWARALVRVIGDKREACRVHWLTDGRPVPA